MQVYRSRYLIIATMALIATMAVPPTYAQPDDPAIMLVNVTAMAWKNISVVKIENNEDNIYDIKLVWLTLENGIINSAKSVDGWGAEVGSNTNTVQFRTDANPIHPGESVRFGVKSDQASPIFKWIILDEDGDELGSGLLDVEKSMEETAKNNQQPVSSGAVSPAEGSGARPAENDREVQPADDVNANGNEKPAVIIPDVPPAIKIRPKEVEPGERVKIVGEGFTPNTRLLVLFDGTTLARLSVGEDGTVKDRLTMPREMVKGAHQISVSDSEGRAANMPITVTIEQKIIPLTANLAEESYKQGDLVKIDGTGKAGSAVHLTVKNPTGLEILSIAVPVDKDSNYSAFIPVSLDATPGSYQVSILQEGKTIEASYTIITVGGFDISVITDKFEYRVGENVQVSGKALPGRDVGVMIVGPDGSEILDTMVKADSAGNYKLMVPVTHDFAFGKYSALVKINDEEISITFNVVAGSVYLTVQTDKETYTDGELVRISGHGMANDKVSIIIETPKVDVIKMSAVTKEDGTYTALWLVSDVAKSGKYKIVAEQGADTAMTAFSVS
ncbi:MAG: hypothetical protein ACE5JV_01660 [Nitrososphaerales archaeon]